MDIVTFTTKQLNIRPSANVYIREWQMDLFHCAFFQQPMMALYIYVVQVLQFFAFFWILLFFGIPMCWFLQFWFVNTIYGAILDVQYCRQFCFVVISTFLPFRWIFSIIYLFFVTQNCVYNKSQPIFSSAVLSFLCIP